MDTSPLHCKNDGVIQGASLFPGLPDAGIYRSVCSSQRQWFQGTLFCSSARYKNYIVQTLSTSRALPSKTSSEKLHEQCTSTAARPETGATLEEILRQSLEVVLVQARVRMGNREQQRQKGQIRMSGETLQASAQPPLLPCQGRVTLQILDPPTAQT